MGAKLAIIPDSPSTLAGNTPEGYSSRARTHAPVHVPAPGFDRAALLAVPTGALSGGVTGVLIQSAFGATAPEWLLGIALALVTGARPIANVTSALWARGSQGRDKIGARMQLQAALAACMALAAAGVIGLRPLRRIKVRRHQQLRLRGGNGPRAGGPLLGVASFLPLEHERSGAGVWSLAFPVALTLAGTLGCARLSRDPALSAATAP